MRFGRNYEGRSESKDRFAIQRYLLIKKKQYAGFITPSPTSPHTVTLDTEALVP
jgi:hypothetical protein